MCIEKCTVKFNSFEVEIYGDSEALNEVRKRINLYDSLLSVINKLLGLDASTVKNTKMLGLSTEIPTEGRWRTRYDELVNMAAEVYMMTMQ